MQINSYASFVLKNCCDCISLLLIISAFTRPRLRTVNNY